MQLEFYRDAAGNPRARCEGPARGVAGFLESDLQDSPAAALEILEAIDEVESGGAPSWRRTGNAYTLTISPEAAVIEDEMNDEAEPYRLTLAEIRGIVEDWLSFLDNGRV
jgi:uncharacterized protein YacL (UPF0231 family)